MSRAPIIPVFQNALTDLLNKALTEHTKSEVTTLLAGGAFLTAEVMTPILQTYFESKNVNLNSNLLENFQFCFNQAGGFNAFVMALVNTTKQENKDKFKVAFKLVGQHLTPTESGKSISQVQEIAREVPALSNLMSMAIYFDLFKELLIDIQIFLSASVSPLTISKDCKEPLRVRPQNMSIFTDYPYVYGSERNMRPSDSEKRYKTDYFAVPAIWEATYRNNPTAVTTLLDGYRNSLKSPETVFRFRTELTTSVRADSISNYHTLDLKPEGMNFYAKFNSNYPHRDITPFLFHDSVISLADFARMQNSSAQTSLGVQVATLEVLCKKLQERLNELHSNEKEQRIAIANEAEVFNNKELLSTRMPLDHHKHRTVFMTRETIARNELLIAENSEYQAIADARTKTEKERNLALLETRRQLCTIEENARNEINASETKTFQNFAPIKRLMSEEQNVRRELFEGELSLRRNAMEAVIHDAEQNLDANNYLSNSDALFNTFKIALPDAKTLGDCINFRDQLTRMLLPLEALHTKFKSECDDKESSVKKQKPSSEKTPDEEKLAVLKAGLDFLTHRIEIIKRLRDFYHQNATRICAGAIKTPSQELLYTMLLAIQFLHSLDNNKQYSYKRINFGGRLSDTTNRVNELLAVIPAEFKNKLIGVNAISITEGMMNLYASDVAVTAKAEPSMPIAAELTAAAAASSVPVKDNRLAEAISASQATKVTALPVKPTTGTVMELTTWCELHGLFAPKDRVAQTQTAVASNDVAPEASTPVVTESSFFTRFFGRTTDSRQGSNNGAAAPAAKSSAPAAKSS